jgi:two-component system chemotaxis response regulator CheY
MPYVDGLELTKRIRSVDPHVPVIMVTVVDAKDKVMEAIQAGISDYICKPFEREALESKLDRFIPV